MKKLYHNVPVLDSGARGATVTFVERGIGDVLLAWENEAFLAQKELGPAKFEVVAPSLSIVAEPPVSVVDQNVDQHGTRKVAEEYLKYLYSKQGQEIAAKHFYRPRDAAVAAQYAKQFADIRQLVTVDAVFGGWTRAPGHAFRGPWYLRPYLRSVAAGCPENHFRTMSSDGAVDGAGLYFQDIHDNARLGSRNSISRRRGGCCPALG